MSIQLEITIVPKGHLGPIRILTLRFSRSYRWLVRGEHKRFGALRHG